MFEFKNPIHSRATSRTAIKALAATLAAAATLSITTIAIANEPQAAAPTKVLTATFAPRNVHQVEVGDFHFKPAQQAPIHTHDAPAVGYVVKGTIIYQVEGEKVKILREGDAFYEPAGPRILRFDNASATQEAIFIDFNLEQHGEPFIIFEEQPTEAIDRRTLPTINMEAATVSQVDIYTSELPAGQSQLFSSDADATLGLVSEGIVELHVAGQATRRIAAGGTFSFPAASADASAGGGATIVNASAEVKARIVTFQLD